MNIEKRQKDIKKKKEKWEKEKQILLEQQQLKNEKEQILKKDKISTSKIIMLFLFINCTIIELFTMGITILDLNIAKTTGMVDFSPIVTLITAVVGEVISFAIYAAKSTKENTQGGIVYQNMMNEYSKDIAQG